jgi:hypothetical protein
MTGRPLLLLFLLALTLVPVRPAVAADAQVRMEGDAVFAAFDGVPAPQALEAVRRATGVEIVVPPAAVQGKTVTMTADGMPFEQFVRRLLESLDLGGYALVFEPGGTARRIIVVERGHGGPPPPAAPPAEPPATASGPVYIPPAAPPVYIPPAAPPVYIPPAAPPVYIPPATPPVYIPPAGEPRPAPTP